MTGRDDLTLLTSYAADGSHEAFACLVDRYARLVHDACRRRLRDPSLADDAAQVVFLILARKARTLVRTRIWRSPVIADWLHRCSHLVTSNIERERRRRERHEREARMAHHRSQDLQPITDDPHGLDDAIAALPARYRRVVILHYLDGRDRATIAAELGLSEAAVAKRLQRGLEALRQRLTRTGAPASAVAAPFAAIVALREAHGSPLAHTITAYLTGAPIPPAVAAHVAGGLQMMHLTLVKTLLALLVLAAVLTGGTIGVVRSSAAQADPAPAPPAASVRIGYALKKGDVFYYDSLLTWSLDMSETPTVDPKQWWIPRSMCEYIVYRAEVLSADAQARTATVTVCPLWGWRVSDDSQQMSATGLLIMGQDGTDRAVAFEGRSAGSFPCSAPCSLEMTEGTVTPHADQYDWQRSDFGPALNVVGLNDLLLPIPDRTYALGAAIQLAEAVLTATGSNEHPLVRFDQPRFVLPEKALFTTTMEAFGVKMALAVSASATGHATSEVEWDPVRHLPRATTTDGIYDMVMISRPVDSALAIAPRLATRVTIRRQSRMLDTIFPESWPRDAPAVLGAVRAERLTDWCRRFDAPVSAAADETATIRLLHDLAFGVLSSLRSPPPVVGNWTPPEVPPPAPLKDF